MHMTSPSIKAADFAKTVRMSKLQLSPDESINIHSQLDEALKAIEVFNELDLKNIEPLAHPSGLKNALREDVVTPSFTQAQALQNAPASHQGYVMVPGVFEGQDS